MALSRSLFCLHVGLIFWLGAVHVGPAGAFQFISFEAWGGNNNVRNSFYGALEVAWLAQLKFDMKVTVVAPKEFGGSACDLLRVFDMPLLEKKTGIRGVSIVDLSSSDRANAQRDWNDGRCQFSSDPPQVWMDKFAALKRDGACKVGARYVHQWEDSAGRFDIEWQPFKIRELYAAAQFRESILQLGAALRELLPKDYIAVHYRAGDKSPMPLLNCSKYGFTRAGLRSRACTHKHDYLRALVSYEEVLLDLWRVKPPRTVFVATHSFDDDRYQLFVATLIHAGLDVVTLPDLKNKLDAAKRDELQKKNEDVGYLTSWIDQYLCAHAEEFLPAATSTWTQLVVIMRRELGKKDADEWVQLYAEAFRLYGADATHYQYYDGGEGSQIIPNFETRCPTGTAVAGKYCLCNNAASKCVLQPKLPAPEGGKGCLSDRRFSPVTFRRSNGFHSSCIACRCDPFDGFD